MLTSDQTLKTNRDGNPALAQKPMCFLSVMHQAVFDQFSQELIDLAESAELVFSAPDNVAVPEAFLEAATLDHLHETVNFADTAAFARQVCSTKAFKTPFVLRLSLRAGSDEEIFASRATLQTLASVDALELMSSAFDQNKKLGIVGPDVLFKSLFPLIGAEHWAFSKLGDLAKAELISADHGAFPLQCFAISPTLLDQLRPVLAEYDRLLSDARTEDAYQQPNNIGRALDLGWLPLAQANGFDVGLVRRRLPGGRPILREGRSCLFSQEVGRDDPMLDTLRRVSRMEPDYKMLAQEPDFDEAAYLAANGELVPDGFGALEHFVVMGDAARLNIGGSPNLNAYRIAAGPKINSFDNTLAHWIVRQRPDTNPNNRALVKAAEVRRFLDIDWCAANNPEFPTPETARKAIFEHSFLSNRATSPNFDPATIPVLRDPQSSKSSQGLKEYFCHHFHPERRAYQALGNALKSEDYGKAQDIAEMLSNLYGPTKGLMGAQILLALHNQNWDRAHSLANALWANPSDRSRVRHDPSLIDQFPTANSKFSTSRGSQKINLEDVCVYTTLMDGIDDLLPVMRPVEGLRFICFSDRPRQAPGWEVRVVTPRFKEPVKSAKYYKVLPHDELPEFRWSLFIDANSLVVGHIESLIKDHLAGEAFAMWTHPERSDLYREAVAILQARRHEPTAIIDQIKSYAMAGLPPLTGLAEASFLWRDHECEKTLKLMQDWWQEIQSKSSRDQLSLGYLFWKTGHKPAMIPRKLGNSRWNAFFVKVPHRSAKRADFPRTKSPVTFLYHPERRNSGSTIMRGEQLSQLVSQAMPDRHVQYASGLSWHGRILFLTKGFLEKASVEDLVRLREANNYLIGDFVDARPDREKGALLQAIVASSIAAYHNNCSAFPTTPIFHLTHHVDPRLTAGNDAADFSCGYSGETVNAIWTDAIREHVTVNHVSTKVRDDSWIAQMRDFNFHYAVREVRDIDGFKPFLKGFTAAHCDAPILTQKSVGDAVFYLGEDYPFFVPTAPTEDEITNALGFAKEAYGGPVWKDALERMRDLAERTSTTKIVQEFKAMIET